MNRVKFLQMKKDAERLAKENQFLRDNYCSKQEIVRMYAIFRCAITETIGEPELQKVLEAIKDLPYEFAIQLYPQETKALSDRLGITKPIGVDNGNKAIREAIREATKRIQVPTEGKT